MAQIEVERDGHVMIVTMNRPKRKNAMTLTMFALMADAWTELSEDDDLRCAILTGAEGNFSSGMDLRAMAGDVDPDGAIDEQARLKDDPGFVYRGLLEDLPPDEAGHRRGRGRRDRRRHRDPAGHRHPRRRRERPLRRVGGALVAVPDGRLGGAAAAPDPLHRRRRHPAHGTPHLRRRRPRRSASSATWCPTGRRSRRRREVAAVDRRERPARGRGDPQDAARDRAHERGRGVRPRSRVHGAR